MKSRSITTIKDRFMTTKRSRLIATMKCRFMTATKGKPITTKGRLIQQ